VAERLSAPVKVTVAVVPSTMALLNARARRGVVDEDDRGRR
jgi:hypothetical protein